MNDIDGRVITKDGTKVYFAPTPLCPYCGSPKFKMIHPEDKDRGTRNDYECQDCKNRYDIKNEIGCIVCGKVLNEGEQHYCERENATRVRRGPPKPGFKLYRKKPLLVWAKKMDGKFSVLTPHGQVHGEKGDYLCEDVEGGFYPCKASVFKKTYEEANDESPRMTNAAVSPGREIKWG